MIGKQGKERECDANMCYNVSYNQMTMRINYSKIQMKMNYHECIGESDEFIFPVTFLYKRNGNP